MPAPTQLLRVYHESYTGFKPENLRTSYGVNMFTRGCHHVSQYPKFSLESNDYTVGQNDYRALPVSAAHSV